MNLAVSLEPMSATRHPVLANDLPYLDRQRRRSGVLDAMNLGRKCLGDAIITQARRSSRREVHGYTAAATSPSATAAANLNIISIPRSASSGLVHHRLLKKCNKREQEYSNLYLCYTVLATYCTGHIKTLFSLSFLTTLYSRSGGTMGFRPASCQICGLILVGFLPAVRYEAPCLFQGI